MPVRVMLRPSKKVNPDITYAVDMGEDRYVGPFPNQTSAVAYLERHKGLEIIELQKPVGSLTAFLEDNDDAA